MASYPSLAGKLVLITGGGGGIGAAMVEAFAHQDTEVVFVDVDAQGAQRTADAAAKLGPIPPRFGVCDLRDIKQTLATLDELLRGRSLHALVNNAGNDSPQRFGEVSIEEWDDRVAVNLRHQYFIAQHVAAKMRDAKRGAIVNLGSISWMIGAPGVSVYTTLKSAVAGLTKSLARELGPDGIRVNAIAPGWVLTERQLEKGARHPEKFAQYLERQCLKTHLQPHHVAELALWLCADESEMCTAQTFVIDGGVV